MESHSRPLGAIVALLAVVLTVTGCAGLREVLGFGAQLRQVQAQARVGGRIETQGEPQGTLVVLLARAVEGEGEGEGEGERVVGVDTYVRTTQGTYLFLVDPGRYQVGAYEDRNGNGLLDPDERVSPLRGSPVHDLAPGGTVRFDLLLRDDSPLGAALAEPVDVLALIERTPDQQREFSLWAFSREGVVIDDLDDDRFGLESGRRGLWRPMDFLNDELAGIYFMEPYDPDRTPVLFVHGIAGAPREFSSLVRGLDRERFQAWLYFYPSGLGLDTISSHLATLIKRVGIATGFDEIAIVAHSMGGLVARGAIQKYEAQAKGQDVSLFVSISTPWGGATDAVRAERATVALPESFRDMSPSSDYLRWLLLDDEGNPKRLPRRLDYHMILGFRGRGAACNDGTVSCASQARREVQEQARSVRAWDYGHTEILDSPETSARIDRLLAERF